MNLQLFTREGDLVATVRVASVRLPDIVRFEGRMFFLDGTRYVEAMTIVDAEPLSL